ncbi:MAG: hypothetical protein LBJ02_00785 [Bifidobacteriaceae bacterium]|nr:hypothetical protein [Bifidobacteriaceae bacterium]
MARDEQWQKDFTRRVTEAVLDQTGCIAPGTSDRVKDRYDDVHQALWLFCEKCKKEPNFFNDAGHAVGWVLATYGNLRDWAREPDAASLNDDAVAAAAEAIPGGPVWLATRTVAPGTPALEPVPELAPGARQKPEPADVICQYFASDDAHHTGRLSLQPRAITVVQRVAQAGFTCTGQRIPTKVWKEIAGELGMTNLAARNLYAKARLSFAVVYYVIGALGPPGGLASTEALGRAIGTFRDKFRGQREWSVLKFAAHAAVPCGDCAQVSPPLYEELILAHPDQAERLGFHPGGPTSAELLDPIEHQAAAVFGRTDPRCALTAEQAPAGHEEN